MEETLDLIAKQFTIIKQDKKRDDLTYITIAPERLLSLLFYLKQNTGLKHFVLLSAVDFIENNLFQLTYHLNNPEEKFIIGIRVEIDREKATMESAHTAWPTIATYQREIKELYGIDFPGSPGVDEELVLEGWDDIPPFRRDFDTLKYSEETYFARPGRSKEDPKNYMKKQTYGEWKKEDNHA